MKAPKNDDNNCISPFSISTMSTFLDCNLVGTWFFEYQYGSLTRKDSNEISAVIDLSGEKTIHAVEMS